MATSDKRRFGFTEEVTMMDRRRLLQAGVGAAAASTLGSRLASGQEASPAAVATPIGEVDENGYYPSGDVAVPDAYTKMPDPFQGTNGTPGSGGTVTAMVLTYGAPPKGKDENLYWQGLEERLGVSWEPILVPSANYGEKASTLIASGDMPELFYLNFIITGTPLQKFVQDGAFTDLTDRLSGDALQEYPNLATFPDYMWESATIDGKIYGVPCPSNRTAQVPAFRRDWSDVLIGGKPTNAEEAHEVFVGMSKNDPDGNGSDDTWGLGKYGSGWEMGFFPNMFRVPAAWKVNDDGTFVSQYETEEWRMYVEYMRRLFEDGAFHPDAPAMQYDEALSLFSSGRTGLHSDGSPIYGPGGFLEQIRQYQPDAIVERLIPPGHDGGQGVTYNGSGTFGFTAIPITVSDDERISELLRILDWLSAPFGSEEWLFKTFGEESVHFEYNKNGFPISNDTFAEENGGLTGYLGGALIVNYDPLDPEIGPILTDEQKAIYEIGIDNPGRNLFSPTQIEEGGRMGQIIADSVTDVISGRADVSSLEDTVQQWLEAGGDAVRGEYEEAYAANQG